MHGALSIIKTLAFLWSVAGRTTWAACHKYWGREVQARNGYKDMGCPGKTFGVAFHYKPECKYIFHCKTAHVTVK